MAVKIRLQRRGKTKQPVYRIVVQDSRVARDGKVIDQCGLYNPVRKPAVIQIDGDKIKAWMSKGALPSKTVERLLVSQGLLAATIKPIVASKKTVTPKKETVKTTAKKAATPEKPKDVTPEAEPVEVATESPVPVEEETVTA